MFKNSLLPIILYSFPCNRTIKESLFPSSLRIHYMYNKKHPIAEVFFWQCLTPTVVHTAYNLLRFIRTYFVKQILACFFVIVNNKTVVTPYSRISPKHKCVKTWTYITTAS
nr:MAG TPA: hypothetical protein [Caudoviricetes sp.]